MSDPKAVKLGEKLLTVDPAFFKERVAATVLLLVRTLARDITAIAEPIERRAALNAQISALGILFHEMIQGPGDDVVAGMLINAAREAHENLEREPVVAAIQEWMTAARDGRARHDA